MRITNRDKILAEAIVLFNRMGAAATTTNHICKALKISPGNLYFHFRNKEEIVIALFRQMCAETERQWKKALGGEADAPLDFISGSLKIFWEFRFFHREMYHLRRQDPGLNAEWYRHLEQTRRFMRKLNAHWIRKGYMRRVENRKAARMIGDIVLVTASSFFQFYETIERPATERPLRLAREHLKHYLYPYFTPGYARSLTGNDGPA